MTAYYRKSTWKSSFSNFINNQAYFGRHYKIMNEPNLKIPKICNVNWYQLNHVGLMIVMTANEDIIQPISSTIYDFEFTFSYGTNWSLLINRLCQLNDWVVNNGTTALPNPAILCPEAVQKPFHSYCCQNSEILANYYCVLEVSA